MKVTATALLSCYGKLNGISVLDEEDMEEDMSSEDLTGSDEGNCNCASFVLW